MEEVIPVSEGAPVESSLVVIPMVGEVTPVEGSAVFDVGPGGDTTPLLEALLGIITLELVPVGESKEATLVEKATLMEEATLVGNR